MEATPPYKILKTLYEGNEGPVYLIKDKNNKQWVMKKYNYDVSDYGIKPEMLSEIMLLKIFKNKKNILQLDHIEFNTGEANIIVEKMDDTIHELILNHSYLSEIKNYMKQILNGLQILHHHGVLHNDLKPINIMYKKNKSKIDIKIIDFGLAHLINFPYYRAKNIATTHHYTPPEYDGHREIGRISLNSDLYTLGIIFYYFLFPNEYKLLDDHPDHDNIFDPHHVNWKAVKNKAGVNGMNLLQRMLELNPDKRITSTEAYQHPFFDKEQKGGKRLRRWEIPNIMSYGEYINPTNQDTFLTDIIKLSEKNNVEIKPLQKIPFKIFNLLYEYFDRKRLKFITINYAIILLYMYVSNTRIHNDDWEYIALACLYLSMKINEFDMNSSVNIFRIEDNYKIVDFEEQICRVIKFNFPLPILITREVILYKEFLEIIYHKVKKINVELIGNIYNLFYILNLLSSVMYTSHDLLQRSKKDLVDVILSLPFSTKHNNKIRKEFVDLLKSHKISLIDKDLLKFIGV